MKKLSLAKKVLAWAGALLASITALGILAWTARVWTDYQWYASVGQSDVFWVTSFSKVTVWLAFAAVGFAVFFFSTRAAWLVVSAKSGSRG
jgi:hypothetical protein